VLNTATPAYVRAICPVSVHALGNFRPVVSPPVRYVGFFLTSPSGLLGCGRFPSTLSRQRGVGFTTGTSIPNPVAPCLTPDAPDDKNERDLINESFTVIESGPGCSRLSAALFASKSGRQISKRTTRNPGYRTGGGGGRTAACVMVMPATNNSLYLRSILHPPCRASRIRI